ncbi:unnamed protein product [Staurois parvus]|uniref:Uncharacterized protein n=1 Tax=Staurois parvus TaxID=386267 RepID=A0ABN9HWA1_9NEOB|nr:unnamed protein product [Staurois parvus]
MSDNTQRIQEANVYKERARCVLQRKGSRHALVAARGQCSRVSFHKRCVSTDNPAVIDWFDVGRLPLPRSL